MYEYHQASTALLDQIVEANKSVLSKAIAWMAETIIEDRIIHTFGTDILISLDWNSLSELEGWPM